METSLVIIKSFFESKASSFIKNREDNFLLEESYSNIIEYILNKKNLDKDKFFNYSSLFSASKLDSSDKKQKTVFIKTVYVLVHPNVDFLEQKFQFLNDRDSFEIKD